MLQLRSKLRRDLLGYFFTNPDAEHYLRELAALLHADAANLSRELAALAQLGIFQWRLRGRLKFYRLNRAHPLFEEYRRIISKTIGVEGQLRRLFASMPGIQQAYLFGSFASNRQDSQSDIDVLLVGSPDPEKLASEVRKLEKRLARAINYTLLSKSEFQTRRKKRDAFLLDALRHKVDLMAA
ncbi:MAG: nucleotidyltransferase domain-containing protein [Acidobacteria bacterium]|nr:nucleotidyltransferase domain-containing protein [Acidobacteriota bacterium]